MTKRNSIGQDIVTALGIGTVLFSGAIYNTCRTETVCEQKLAPLQQRFEAECEKPKSPNHGALFKVWNEQDSVVMKYSCEYEHWTCDEEIYHDM